MRGILSGANEVSEGGDLLCYVLLLSMWSTVSDFSSAARPLLLRAQQIPSTLSTCGPEGSNRQSSHFVLLSAVRAGNDRMREDLRQKLDIGPTSADGDGVGSGCLIHGIYDFGDRNLEKLLVRRRAKPIQSLVKKVLSRPPV
jgi:hypothetical protein